MPLGEGEGAYRSARRVVDGRDEVAMGPVAVKLSSTGAGRRAGGQSHGCLGELEVHVGVAVVHDTLGSEEDFFAVTGRGVACWVTWIEPRAAYGVDVADVVFRRHGSGAPRLDSV